MEEDFSGLKSGLAAGDPAAYQEAYDRFGAATPFGISALLVVAALLLLLGFRHRKETPPFRT